MSEAIRRFSQSTLIGTKSESSFFLTIPYHLQSNTLLRIDNEEGSQGKLWNERGNFIEQRVQSIISALPIVETVIRHAHGSQEDMNGHDLTVKLDKNSPIETVYIQVKSSRQGIIDYKRQIRDKLPQNDRWNMELVGKWMTINNIILLNGGETKSNNDIVESFYPQLERIKQKTLIDKNIQIQIFPEVL